jgi:hypothetical protein
MTNSLERIFDGIIDVLHSRVIPKIHDESARSQAYGALDMLRNLKPRVEWAVGPLRDDVVAGLSLCARIAALLEDAKPAPPSPPLEGAPTYGPTAAELEPLRDRLDEHLCEVLRWIAVHREMLRPGSASEIETAIRDQQRVRLKREVKLTAPPLLGEISRGQ